MNQERGQQLDGLRRVLEAIQVGRQWAANLPPSVRVGLRQLHGHPNDLMGGWTLGFPEKIVPGFFAMLAAVGCRIYILDQDLLLPLGQNAAARLTRADLGYFTRTLDQLIAELSQTDAPVQPYIVTQGHVNLVKMIDERHSVRGAVSCFPLKEPLHCHYLGHVAGMEGGLGFYDAAQNRLTFDYESTAEAVRSLASRLVGRSKSWLQGDSPLK